MKSKVLLIALLGLSGLLFCYSSLWAGEPVIGARIVISLQPNNQQIAVVTTSENGMFTFKFPNGMQVPKSGIFEMVIIPPNKINGPQSQVNRMERQTLTIAFNGKEGPEFRYYLTWDENQKAQTKGAFAISGKSSI